jgi:hypothetical protein
MSYLAFWSADRISGLVSDALNTYPRILFLGPSGACGNLFHALVNII